jgi:chromosomal replication initiation ATPase DnaA
VNDHIDKPEFAYFLKSCLDKWAPVKLECDIMDAIMKFICDHYKITPEELIHGKKAAIPRSLMFYLMKRSLKKLSFETLGDIFKRQKSYVYKCFDDAKFMVQRHKRKDPIFVVTEVETLLKLERLVPEDFDFDKQEL